MNKAALFLLLFIVSSIQEEIEPKVSEVDDVTLKQMIDDLKEEERIVAKFYAKWCSFSKDIEPIYNTLPQVFPNLTIVSIDGAKYNSLNEIYAVHAFPRIYVFKPSSAKLYDGNRTFESLTAFIQNHTKMEPVQGIEVQYPPEGRINTEGYFYLYWSGAMFAGVLSYVLWVVYRLAVNNREKQD
eukprot:TRINITY_DN3560_c0_g1_i1.p1 TRINITY_DN3560_c0_g1~~TRINITY_DN3560_c0_g1_i1.p1  ORF type:complete len:184 (-),score=39.99 TRINITY_DN3560_c0_g1_i1:172-723(-)